MSEALHSAMLETVATTQDVELLRRDVDMAKSGIQAEIGQVRMAVAESKVWTSSLGATSVAVLAAMEYFG